MSPVISREPQPRRRSLLQQVHRGDISVFLCFCTYLETQVCKCVYRERYGIHVCRVAFERIGVCVGRQISVCVRYVKSVSLFVCICLERSVTCWAPCGSKIGPAGRHIEAALDSTRFLDRSGTRFC